MIERTPMIAGLRLLWLDLFACSSAAGVFRACYKIIHAVGL